MKIKYLGTAAAEGVPAMFCKCEICTRARLLGGRNYRSRSQALVNDDLLIDFPADAYMHEIKYGIDYSDIRNCLITHNHDDHFYAKDMHYVEPGLSYISDDYCFNVYGSKEIKNVLKKSVKECKGKLACNEVKPFEPFKVLNYTVTALKATHGTKYPFIYIIEQDGKRLLYAHDTDIFPKETWDYLIKNKICFNMISLDCTEGNRDKMDYCGHMFFGSNKIVRDKMKENGLIDEKTIMVLNHFSHNGKKSNYTDFAPVAEKEGFIVSYDGMEIEF